MAGRPRKAFRVVAFLGRRIPVILIVGGLLGAAFALLLLPWARPVYEAESILIVDPAKEPTLTGRERDVIPGDLGDYTRTLVVRATRYDILADALTHLNASNAPPFLRLKDPESRNVDRLLARLKMQEVPRTHLMRATLCDSEPTNLGPALEAIMQSFVTHLRREQEQQNDQRLAYLRAERDDLAARVEAERGRLLELAGTVSNKAFLFEAYTVHLAKVEQVQRLYWEAAARAAELQGALQQANRNRDQLGHLNLQAFADERVADNFGINRIEQWTYEQLQGMRAGIDGLTVSNADRRYVEARMQSMNDFLAGYKSNVVIQTQQNLKDKRAFELDTDVIKAQNAFDGAQKAADELATKLGEAQTEAARTSEAIFMASDMNFAITSLRERLVALNTRIDDCELETKAPLRISIDRDAVTPKKPARSNRTTFLMIALALGFGSVAAVCLVFDMVDNRIRDARDVESALGGPGPDPVTAFVSGVAPAPVGARMLLDAPDHPSSLALRDLAVRLSREHERFGAKVFLFAGIESGTGCTTLALQTAHLLGLACEKVLLIEVNRERPGLAAALALHASSAVTLESAIGDPASEPDRDPERGIWVLPASGSGPVLVDQAGLLGLLQRARQAFDAIVIDSAPLHSSAVAHACALHADAAVLVVREDVSLFRDLRRSLDLLIQADVPALTAILNHAMPPAAGPLAGLVQAQLRVLSVVHVRARAYGRGVLERAVTAWKQWRGK